MTRYNFDRIIDRNETSSVKYDLRGKIFNKKDVIPMWVADMDFATPDFITDAIKERLKHQILGYSFRSDKYFESIESWFKSQHDWSLSKEWIAFSPGIVPALNIIVRAFTNQGDKIIVQPPVYYPFFSAINSNHRVQVNNPLILQNGRLCIDFEHLESVMDDDVRMFILCSPHNPGGSVWNKEELEQIANLCLEKDILLVSDEIHCDLVFKPNKHIPVASLSKKYADITITCVAPSKTFNIAGLSTSSVIISNEHLRETYNRELDRLHIGMGNIFGAIASEAAYTHGGEWLESLLKYLRNNIDITVNFFKRNITRINVIRPEATYLLWLDCRGLGMKDEELQEFFINEAGVGLSPGIQFGEGGEGFMRMNIACPEKLLLKALTQLEESITKL